MHRLLLCLGLLWLAPIRGEENARLGLAAADALLEDAARERLACRLTVQVRDARGVPDTAARVRVTSAAGKRARATAPTVGALDAPTLEIAALIARAEETPSAPLRVAAFTGRDPPALDVIAANLDRIGRSGLTVEVEAAAPAATDGEPGAVALRRLLARLLVHPAVDAVQPGDDEAARALRRVLPAELNGTTGAQGVWTGLVPRGHTALSVLSGGATEARPVLLGTEHHTESFGAAAPAASVHRLRAEAEWRRANPPPSGPVNIGNAPPAPR